MHYTWIHATNDQIISKRPCFISCLMITPSSATKKGDCTIYDGENNTEPQIITVLTLQGETKVIKFSPPLETKRGLYLDYGGDTQEVLIQFCWHDE